VSGPTLSVSLGLWQDRPAAEVLDTAIAADELGYPDLWIGEMATFDAFALAAVIAERTSRIGLTVGPLAVAVRDPAMIAIGVATLTELTGRHVAVALGTSSPVVVEQWHGRRQERTATALAESAEAVRALLAGERADVDGVVRTHGYRLRAAPPRSPITIAAFGRGAIRVAARHGDRMVLNLLTPESAGRLVAALREECAAAGRPVPTVAAWVSAAVDPSPEAIHQLRRGLVPYLAVPGYRDMFAEAGFADLVSFAQTRPHPRELLAATPEKVVQQVSLVGDVAGVRARIAEYGEAGVDEVVVVPSSCDADPGGVATLRALA
jgi:probable F420-dependent oxidoreductase